MGPHADGFVDAIVQVARQYRSGFRSHDGGDQTQRSSNYLGITITVTATSRPQLDELYRTLTAHPMVKIIL